MKNFIAKISKFLSSKKIITLVLFCVALGSIIPTQAHAGWLSWIPGFDSMTNSVMNALVAVIGGAIIGVTSIILIIAVSLLHLAIAISVGGVNYIDNIAINVGWPIVRDLANMMIILGVIVIALATILRIRNYELQKLLLPLIISALLINFSLVICGVFIDVSNIVLNFFFTKGGDGIGTELLRIIKDVWGTISSTNELPPVYIARLAAFAFYEIMATLVISLYIAMLFFRIVALWILVILSPMAFVCRVFPYTQKFWRMWLDNFTQWLIIGAPAGLFYYIASKMVSAGAQIPISLTDTSGIFSAETFQKLSGSLSLFVPGLFLIMGFLFALRTSAMGANMITSKATSYAKQYGGAMAKNAWSAGKSAGQKAGQWAGSAASWINNATGNRAGGVANTIWNSSPVKKTRAGASAVGQGAKWVANQTGYTMKTEDEKKQKNVSAYASNMKAQKDDALLDIVKSKALTNEAKDKKAAAIIELQERGKFNTIPQADREAAVKHAVERGGMATEKLFTKEQPHLVTGVTDQDAVDKLKENEAQKRIMDFANNNNGMISNSQMQAIRDDVNKNYEPNQYYINKTKTDMVKEKTTQNKVGYKDVTEQEAKDSILKTKEDEIRENNKKYTEAQVQSALSTFEKSIKDSDIENKMGELKQRRIQEKSLGYESSSYEDAKQKIISDKINDLEKLEKITGVKIDIDQAVKTFSDGLSFATISNGQKLLDAERIGKSVDKMSPSKVADLSKEAMTEEITRHFSENQMTSIFRNASNEVKGAFEEAAQKYMDSIFNSNTSTPEEITKANDFYQHMREASARATKY